MDSEKLVGYWATAAVVTVNPYDTEVVLRGDNLQTLMVSPCKSLNRAVKAQRYSADNFRIFLNTKMPSTVQCGFPK